ncbi:sugar kinase [Clostridia bacterium]|nr:sugar kinase [Clostridia bacterium]
MKKGISVAGNIIIDNVKIIDGYPPQGNLCNIRAASKSTGGAVCNTGISLARLDRGLRVSALGCVGGDSDGEFALGRLRGDGLDVSGVRVQGGGVPTGFTDVMTDGNTGARTFFHARGANASFDFPHIDFDSLSCDIFHMGYALLLDKFDAPDPECGTVMAKALRAAQKKGLKTSLDVVSENGGRFKRIVTPSLKYCDYAVMNEIEGGMISGIEPRDAQGAIIPENIEKICRALFAAGVGEYAVIHCPEAGYMACADGKFVTVPSLRLPEGYVQGTVGAGDAFCAGILYSLYKEYEPARALTLAAACAAANLSASDSVGGMRSLEDTWALDKKYRN